MRVVQLIPSLARAGPVRVALDLVRHLDRSRFSPVLVPVQTPPAQAARALSAELDIEIRPLAAPWWLRGDLAALLADLHAGIVHAHCYIPLMLAARLPPRVPKIATLHVWPWLDYREVYGGFQGALMWSVERRLLRRMDAIVPCSRALALELDGHYGMVTPVPNGVDPAAYRIATAECRAAARRALGISRDTAVFIYVGPLIRRKRVLTLISAYRGAGLHNARLLLVGDGPLADRSKAAACGDISVLGLRTDVPWLLAAADVYVSASVTEGLPLSVLEAYRTGLKLVLSDIPAHREVLAASPGAGRVFKTAQDLETVLRQERQALENAGGAAPVRPHFSAADMAAAYERLYDKLTGKERACLER